MAIALAGCVTQYRQPVKGADSSKATFIATRQGKQVQDYWAWKDKACRKSELLGRLAFFSIFNPEQKVVTLHPNEPIYSLVYVMSPSGTAENLSTKSCTNYFTFTPEAAHEYRVRQIVENAHCRVEVLDTTTQSQANGFKELDITPCER